jgi:hypothetical protein
VVVPVAGLLLVSPP